MIQIEYKRHYNPYKLRPLYYCNGAQALYKFENGFGASVISGDSLKVKCNKQHPYELMLLFSDVPSTQISAMPANMKYLLEDTVGYLNEQELDTLLDQIAGL